MKTMIDRIINSTYPKKEVEKILVEIGCEETEFVNPSGFEYDFHYSDLIDLIVKFLEHINKKNDNTESIPL